MTTAKAAMAVLSFDERIKIARKLVDEGHRLMGVMHRDLDAGSLMVRNTRELLDALKDKPRDRLMR